ncbi:MAG: DPP IV N-terminal domain-containing protein [Gemmatimonas sp.]
MVLSAPLSAAVAQGATAAGTAPPRANWTLAERFGQTGLRTAVYSAGVAPRWVGESDSLFYNWKDNTGSRFYLVVPALRAKRPLFDHVKLAAALSELHRRPYDAHNLPFSNINFTKNHKAFRFNVDSSRYEWTLATETLKSLPRLRRDSIPQDEERAVGGGGGQGGGGALGQQPDFRNFSPDSTAFAFARDHNLFVVEVATNDTVKVTTDGVRNYSLGFRDTTFSQLQQQQQQQEDLQQLQIDSSRSRDQRVRPGVIWSPDSKAFIVQRNDSRKVKELYLVNVLSNPRPTLSSYTYAMPGEENVSQQEVYLFRRGEKTMAPVNVKHWKDQRIVNIHWPSATSTAKLRMMRRDRLQRNLELVEIDLQTNAVKTLITESVENANLEVQNARYTKAGGDIIWWSERSGWGHYYLYSNDGAYKRPLTSGAWRAEDIVQIDSLRGVVYVAGVGREDGENPYYRHLYRVNADGTGFSLLNPGNFSYSTAMSPTKRYMVETFSRIDAVPKSVLRDVSGAVVMGLEDMDVSRLKELGWKMPERFTVKAADGITDIYGNMWKPFDFDSTKKYPIIAHVYPGPQTEGVTYTFAATNVPQQLAQLGFIVIQIGNRGGSPQRSNAYQSFSYFNMRDYALADKKAGIEQLAARYPFIDISKVGIFGHSGGGFLTGAAMMLPPYNDFFKVGVSSSGNHDNNIYNQNWSEQYHGLRIAKDSAAVRAGRIAADGTVRRDVVPPPVNGTGATAADTLQDSVRFSIRVPTNIELARNLKGKLLLTTGDMDNNVHPGGTIRLVDALIKANKRFDMMIMPGQPHGYGPMQPYFNRMLMEYFAEHLLGDNSRGSAEIR